MNQIKIEAFLSSPPSADDVYLSKILEGLRMKFGERLNIAISGEEDGHFKAYHLTATPAIVIGEMIKIMGFCPSEESIVSALRDMGI